MWLCVVEVFHLAPSTKSALLLDVIGVGLSYTKAVDQLQLLVTRTTIAMHGNLGALNNSH